MANELFGEQSDNSKEIEAMKKDMADMKAKLEAESKARESVASDWKKEREQLEGDRNRYKKDAEAAYAFDKLVNDNPDKAIEAIYEHKKKKQAPVDPIKASEKSSAELESLKKEQEEMRAYLKAKEEKEAVTDFQNALYDAVQDLKSSGVDAADAKEIVEYMKKKGLTSPEHVEVAAKTLYSEPLLEAKIKAKKKSGKTSDAIVMGTQGYSDEEVSDEAFTPEVAQRQPRIAGPKGSMPNTDDKLWKSLENAVFGKQ